MRKALLISSLCLVLLAGSFWNINFVYAQNAQDVLNAGADQVDIAKTPGTLEQISVEVLKAMNWILSFIGLIFFIYTVYAGFLWMTAGGNEEQATKARQSLSRSLIGFAIVFFSLAISYGVTKFMETTLKSR